MMEILDKIILTLTTESELLLNIISIPFSCLEAFITMLLFCSLLNIKSTSKQKLYYVLLETLFGLFKRLFVPNLIGILFNISFATFLIMKIFKTSLLKAIVSQIFSFIIFVLIESILVKFCTIVFGLNAELIPVIPIYRIPFALIEYLLALIIYIVIRRINVNIKIAENIDKKNKILLLFNSVFLFISISIQVYLITFYNDNFSIIITAFSILSLLTYFGISIYSLIRTTQLQLTSQNLEQEKLYNKTLVILHDNIRGFKHDFNNIVSVIGGYISSDDMEGLKNYYSELLEDCKKVNNLDILSPSVINNSAIYSLLSSKYHSSMELGIKMNIEIFLDLNSLGMKIYDFTRIFGVLIDNAIEAAAECDSKVVNIIIRKVSKSNKQLCIIENTYKDKEIDINKIFEKNFSTKNRNSGLGLWEVKQIIKRLPNVTLNTTKTDEFFKQELEILVKE